MNFNKKQMFYIPVFLFFIIWMFIYLGIEMVVGLLGYFIVFALLFYFGFSVIYFIFTRKRIEFTNYIDRFAFIYSIFLLIFGAIIYMFIIYNNDINPAKLGYYELTNTENNKVIRYLSMSHIATKDFYDEVEEELKKAKDDGFALFYEGVQPGGVENTDKFNRLIGFDFNKETYLNLSKVYGLYPQDNQKIIDIFGNKAYNTDISIDDIMNAYENLPEEIKKQLDSISDVPVDLGKQLSAGVEKLSEKQKEMVVVMGKAMLNFVFKIATDTSTLGEGKEGLEEVILTLRNNNLVDSVINSSEDKIIITYGGLHYNGFLKELQKQTNNIRQEKLIKYYYPVN